MKDLYIITSHYPYGKGESFLSDELRVAESHFNKIVIISLSKYPDEIKRFVPANCTVVNMRKRKIFKKHFLKSLLTFLSIHTIREFYFSQTKYKANFLKSLKKLFIDNYIISILSSCFRNLYINYENTVFYSYWLSSSAAFLVKLKQQHPESTYISRAHGGDCFFERGYQTYRREILSGLDAIYPISEAGRKNILSHFGCNVNSNDVVQVHRLGVLKNNTAVNPYDPSEKSRINIVSCSNVIQLKRLDLIIDTLNVVDFCEISWVHFGDGDFMERILDYAREKLSSKSNIHYDFKGFVLNNEILDYYRTHPIDLFINASDVEGIPYSIMEAFSYGIPAVARDVGGNAEIIEDYKNGFLLNNEDPFMVIVERLKEYLKWSADRKIKMRLNALSTYEYKYNAEKNYRVFYQEITNIKTSKYV